MISHSDLTGPRAGATLLEMMVALAVVSLIVVVVVIAARPPSPRLQQEAAVADLVRRVQETRLRAINEGRVVFMGPQDLCDGARLPAFHPDGSARYGPFCIGDREIALKPLTGTLDLGANR